MVPSLSPCLMFNVHLPSSSVPATAEIGDVEVAAGTEGGWRVMDFGYGMGAMTSSRFFKISFSSYIFYKK